MIICDAKRARAYAEAGLWGQASLDVLLRKQAAAQADRVLLVDAENRHDWRRGFDRELTAIDLDRKVSAMSAHLLDLGVKPDDRIVLHLPNTAEMLISLLAILRAGAIAVPVPFAWRRHELVSGLGRINPTALITTSVFDDSNPAVQACETAFEVFSLRYILCFGDDLPDGATSINECLANDAPIEGDQPPPRAGNPGDHIAAILYQSGDPARPVAFSHNQLVTAATLFAALTRLGKDASVLNTIAPACLAGLACALSPLLAIGIRLTLAVPFDISTFNRDLGKGAISHLLLPGIVAASSRVHAAFLDKFSGRLIRYWSDPIRAAQIAMPDNYRAIDITGLDDLALTATENPATIGYIRVGRNRLGEANTGPIVLEAQLKGAPARAADQSPSLLRGELELSGPMCPDAFVGDDGSFEPLAKNGYIATGLRVGFADPAGTMLACTSRLEEYFRIGGILISADATDQLYKQCDCVADATAFAEPDPVFGDRLNAALVPKKGSDFSIRAFRDFLRDAGVADYRMPQRVTVVNAIPRDAEGRVLRRQVAAAA